MQRSVKINREANFVAEYDVIVAGGGVRQQPIMHGMYLG